MLKLATLAGTFAAGLFLLSPAAAQRMPFARMPIVTPPAGLPPMLQTPIGPPVMPVACGPAMPANANGPGDPADAPAAPTTGVVCQGKDLQAAVKKVRSLHWHKSLSAARAEATRSGKPILWLHSLGDLSGFA